MKDRPLLQIQSSEPVIRITDSRTRTINCIGRVCPPEVDPDEVPPLGGNATVPRPTVEIRLEGGHLLSREVDCFPANSLHPVARDALEAKFRDCVSFAPKNIDVAVVLIDDPENVADVAEITRLLRPELAT